MKRIKSHNISSESGVAIIMVMTAITFLVLILATFTYDTKVNKLRLYNHQDRLQAKLNAESGLRFALLKLEIYQKSLNYLEKNKSVKDVVSPQMIQNILTAPFIYPIPTMGDMNIIQQSALNDFNDNVLLEGSLNLSISAVRGYLNPNNMLIKISKKNSSMDTPPADENISEDNVNQKNTNDIGLNTKKMILQLIEQRLNNELSNDDNFNALYANLSAETLVNELLYFITPQGKFDDPSAGTMVSNFDKIQLTPKFAPLISLSELHQLPSWDDPIVELMQDALTTHTQSVINIEKITKSQLLAIFPTMPEKLANEYFEYRDGSEEKELEPHSIKTTAQFEEVITKILGLIPPEDYHTAIENLKKAGLTLGVSNLLFSIKSIGSFNRAKYTLNAIVNIPVFEKIIKKKKNSSPAPTQNEDGGVFNPDSTELQDNPNEPENTKNPKEKKEIEYLLPRVEEISP